MNYYDLLLEVVVSKTSVNLETVQTAKLSVRFALRCHTCGQALRPPNECFAFQSAKRMMAQYAERYPKRRDVPRAIALP